MERKVTNQQVTVYRTEQVPMAPDHDERERAARLAESWGYYRAVEPHEWEAGLWFRYGPHLLWWMVGWEDGWVNVHVCVQPRHRRRIYGRELLTLMRLAAMLVGAVGMRAHGVSDEVADYLRRMGWTNKADEWYCLLPEPLAPLGVHDGWRWEPFGEAEADAGQGSRGSG